MKRTVRIPVLMPAILVMLALPGCMQDQIDATQKLVTQQQAELEQLQQEVAALQSQRAPYSTAPTSPGACDVTVMRVVIVVVIAHPERLIPHVGVLIQPLDETLMP